MLHAVTSRRYITELSLGMVCFTQYVNTLVLKVDAYITGRKDLSTILSQVAVSKYCIIFLMCIAE